ERIHYYSLSLVQDVDVKVVSDHAITVAPKKSHYFSTLFEQLYTTGEPYRVGQTFENGVFLATVEEVSEDNEVRRVRFTFPKPLSSPDYHFMVYDGTSFVPYIREPAPLRN